MKNMTILGVGEKIAFVSFPYLALTIYAGIRFPATFKFGDLPYSLLLGTGCALMVIGLVLNFASAVTMIRAFNSKKLLTTGTYAFCRNPMYASFILLTIPGLALALNSWLVMTTSLIMYMALKVFIKGEEDYLMQQFGSQFAEYKKNVGLVVPRII